MRLALLALLVATSCKRGTEPKAEVSEETRPGPERGSAGGFSASLSADLEVRGKGSGDFFSDSGSGSGSVTGGSGSGEPAGSNAGSSATAGNAGSSGAGSSAGSNAAGSNAAGSTAAGSAGSMAAGSAAGASEPMPAAGSNAPSTGSAKVAAGSAKAADPDIEMAPPKPAIAMTPELKAIKLSLLPNWKRDTVEPATISLDVEVQSQDVKQTFKFHYGYEDPKAPTDREAFKKYLADAKILKVTTDRQRGAAWYLEGDDASGHTAFRLIVTWGGKRLYCGGSSYKTNSLGDIRDEVVVQAKKICETVAL
ncbi:MAG: hypothetical protein AB7T06_05165 [Kofleriaceae bacterium]